MKCAVGLRFALYYINPARVVSYQSQFVARVHSIGDAVANLLMQVSATFNYIRFNANWSDYLDYSLLIGALALATLLIVVPRSEQRPPLKFTLIGFGLGVLAAILAYRIFGTAFSCYPLGICDCADWKLTAAPLVSSLADRAPNLVDYTFNEQSAGRQRAQHLSVDSVSETSAALSSYSVR